MKKSLSLAIFLCTFFSTISFSQSSTLDVTGGYCLAIAPNTEAVERNELHYTTFPYYVTTYAHVKHLSFGKGGNLAFNFNWFSKKNIGFGFKLNLLFGSDFNHTAEITNSLGNKEYYLFGDRSFSFQFIPHLCFRHDYKVVSPVLEAGIIIGMARIDQNYTLTFSNYLNTVRSAVRDYGNVFLGFYTSVGLSFNVSRVVKINLALSCVAGSYSPARWKRNTYTVDGVDQLAALPVSVREGRYVNDLDLQAMQSPDVPHQSLKYSVAFSNVGITTGICFSIAAKHKKVRKKDGPVLIHPF